MNRKTLQLTALLCIISIAFASMASAAEKKERGRRNRRPQGGQMRSPRMQDRPGPRGPMVRQGGPRGMQGRMRGSRGMGPVIRGGMGAGMRIGMFARALNLTEEQYSKLEETQKENLNKADELENKLVELQSEIELAVIDGDKEKVNKLAGQIGQATGEVASLKIEAQQLMVKVLDDEQLKKYNNLQSRQKKMIQNRLKRHEQNMQHQRSNRGYRAKNGRFDRNNSRENRNRKPGLGDFIEEKDSNKDGTVTLEEFKDGTQGRRNPERLFKRLDKDNDGKLTKEEIEKISNNSRRARPNRRNR